MKDLYIRTADADMEAFMNGILTKKRKALGIKDITFDIIRHTNHDNGMVQDGAELARTEKGRYNKALLMFDYHGCGREHQQKSKDIAQEIQNKLDKFTWQNTSAVVVITPELERWLCYCENAIETHFKIPADRLQEWTTEYAKQQGQTLDQIKAEKPKELLQYVIRKKLRKKIIADDFRKIAERASLSSLKQSDSFRMLVETLRGWFPLPP